MLRGETAQLSRFWSRSNNGPAGPFLLTFGAHSWERSSSDAEDPLEALEGAVAEVHRERSEEQPQVPRERRRLVVDVDLGRVGATWLDRAAARRTGAVGVHRGGREEAVARGAPGHGTIEARPRLDEPLLVYPATRGTGFQKSCYWISRTGSPSTYATQLVVSLTVVPAGYANFRRVQQPVAIVSSQS